MFEQLEKPEKQKPDFTGTKIGAALLPVFVLFVYLGKAEMGFTVTLVLGMVMIAIYVRWKLRKHVWFWVAIASILFLHIPLFFAVRWPETNVPMIVYAMPIGIADFLLINGAISLAEKLFSKDSSSEE